MSIAPYRTGDGGFGKWRIENGAAAFYIKQAYVNAGGTADGTQNARVFIAGEKYEFQYSSYSRPYRYYTCPGAVPAAILNAVKIFPDKPVDEEFFLPLTLNGFVQPELPDEDITTGDACLDGLGFVPDAFPETTGEGTSFLATAGGTTAPLVWKLRERSQATGKFLTYQNQDCLDSSSYLFFSADAAARFTLRWSYNTNTGQWGEYPTIQDRIPGQPNIGIES